MKIRVVLGVVAVLASFGVGYAAGWENATPPVQSVEVRLSLAEQELQAVRAELAVEADYAAGTMDLTQGDAEVAIVVREDSTEEKK